MVSGIVIFAHGSSVPSANAAVEAFSRAAAQAGNLQAVETAFLEGHPDLSDALARLSSQGVHRVLVVPYFLTLGLHLQRDLPRIVAELRARYPTLEIRVAPPLDGHPALVEAVLDRTKQCLSNWK